MQSKRPPEYSDGLFCPLAFCSARRRSDTNHRRPGGSPAGSPSPKAPPVSCRNGFPGARISGLRSSVRLFSCICLHIRTQCIRIHVPHTLFLPPADLQHSFSQKESRPRGRGRPSEKKAGETPDPACFRSWHHAFGSLLRSGGTASRPSLYHYAVANFSRCSLRASACSSQLAKPACWRASNTVASQSQAA